jgi:hypothetical protein
MRGQLESSAVAADAPCIQDKSRHQHGVQRRLHPMPHSALPEDDCCTRASYTAACRTAAMLVLAQLPAVSMHPAAKYRQQCFECERPSSESSHVPATRQNAPTASVAATGATHLGRPPAPPTVRVAAADARRRCSSCSSFVIR